MSSYDTGYVVTTSLKASQLFLCECRSTPGLTLVQNLEDTRFLCRFLPGTRALFALHRFPATFSTQFPNPESVASVADLLKENLDLSLLAEQPYDVQVAASWPLNWSGRELREKVAASFGNGAPGEGLPQVVLSLYLHRWCDTNTLFAGVSRVQENLSPWAGGACEFEPEADAVSSSELTLRECEVVLRLDLGSPGRVLDLGAAPGGWTRLMASRGFEVDAVDTESLEPAVESHSGVRFHQQDVEAFLQGSSGGSYDWILCDLDADSNITLERLLQARECLKKGGRILATVKLRKGPRALSEARKVVGMLSRSYQLQEARLLDTYPAGIVCLLTSLA